jgi:hypothetical protein
MFWDLARLLEMLLMAAAATGKAGRADGRT